MDEDPQLKRWDASSTVAAHVAALAALVHRYTGEEDVALDLEPAAPNAEVGGRAGSGGRRASGEPGD